MNACVLSLWQDIKAASLRTLTSIVHLERTPKLSNIIDCTGTASYHGFLPVLVRNCIQAMIGKGEKKSLAMMRFQINDTVTKFILFYFVRMSDPLMEPYPHQFATALFSFLYHLASYDAGGEALVSCGMMEALLKVRVCFLFFCFFLYLAYLLYHEHDFVSNIAVSRWSSSWGMSRTKSLLWHGQCVSWTSLPIWTWLPFNPTAAFLSSSADSRYRHSIIPGELTI